MEAFLESVATTAYGLVLGRIKSYFKKKLEEYDDFIRRNSDQLKILARDNREADEAAVKECFGTLGKGLKSKMKIWARRLAGALVSEHAFSYSGPVQHAGFQDTPESLALIAELEFELDNYLKMQLERLHGELKKNKNSNKTKFSKADGEITDEFKESKKEVEEGEELVGLFEELRGCLENEQRVDDGDTEADDQVSGSKSNEKKRRLSIKDGE